MSTLTPAQRGMGGTTNTRIALSVAAVVAYTQTLKYFGIDRDDNFLLFLVWYIPYNLYLHLVRKVFVNVAEFTFVTALNIGYFGFFNFFMYPMIDSYRGPGLFLHTMVLAVSLIILEYIHFRLFNDDPKIRFLVPALKSISDITDMFAVVLFGIALWAFSSDVDFHRVSSVYNYITLIPLMLIGEFVFGVYHYLIHTHYFEFHQKHHYYKQADLCTYANFYSGFLDGAMMVFPYALTMIILNYIHGSYLVLVDVVLFAGTLTHHKYGQKYLNMVFFYDLDIILDVFAGVKLSAWHRTHHDSLNKHWSSFGLVSDETIVKIAVPFEKWFLRLRGISRAVR
jgi:hypothetical protein